LSQAANGQSVAGQIVGEQTEDSPSPAPLAQAAAVTDANFTLGGERGSSEALQQWRAAVGTIGDMLADYGGLAVAIIPHGSELWNVVFPPGAIRAREVCEQPERRKILEQAVGRLLQRNLRLSFVVMPGEAPRPVATTQPSTSRVQKMREVSENPYVKKCCEVLDGEILRVDPPAASIASRLAGGERKNPANA